MMTATDARVVAYMRRLEAAATSLPPERRAELVDQIGDHIATRLAKLCDSGTGEDPVDLTLARLGEPEEIVAAAGDDPRAREPELVDQRQPRRGRGWVEPAALVLLLLGGFVGGVGWIAGVVLLWMSSRWTVGEKLLGTLVWPGGLAAPVLFGALIASGTSTVCTSEATPVGTTPGGSVPECGASSGDPLGIALFVLALLAPLVVAAVLGVRAARRPA